MEKKYFETTEEYVAAVLEAMGKDQNRSALDIAIEYLVENDYFMDDISEEAEKYNISLDDEEYDDEYEDD